MAIHIWTCTDPDTQQYGSKISNGIYTFKQRGVKEVEINVNAFTYGQIESEISAFGYTLFEPRVGVQNIFSLYPEEYNWIIAECIFENNFC